MSETKSRHDGNCHFYSSVINGRPFDGICTCGFGLQVMCEARGDSYIYLTSVERAESVSLLNKKAARLDAVIELAERVRKQRIADCVNPNLSSPDNPTADYLKELHTIVAEVKLTSRILKIAKGESDE